MNYKQLEQMEQLKVELQATWNVELCYVLDKCIAKQLGEMLLNMGYATSADITRFILLALDGERSTYENITYEQLDTDYNLYLDSVYI